MELLQQVIEGIRGFWRSLNAAQRVALLSIALVTAGAVALLANLSSEPEYATLYSELKPDDAERIREELTALSVPHKLTQAGTALQVPASRVYDLRLELAAKGLPASGPVGFEVFNETGLGITPFQERVRFRRALEGEMSRTITRLEHVTWARVHINLPDRAVFRRDQKQATAAVVVSLAPGASLSAGEVSSIGQLVAGAVEGLQAKNVTIVDSSGQLLARPGGDDDDMLAAEVLGVQRTIEKRLAKRAQGLLDAALGGGRSVVTVSAEVDRRRIEENQDRVSPDETAVLSEQRTEEARSDPSGGANGGIPGTPSNVPGGAQATQTAAAPTPSTETVTRETTNYEVSRSRVSTVVPMGQLQRLSVAVLVDGTYVAPKPAEGSEEAAPAEPSYTPRTPEELAQITEIVKRAVGFDETRGDAIEVQNLAFRTPLEDVATGALPFWSSPELYMLLPGVARGIGILGGIAMLVFLVIRPALNQLAIASALSRTEEATQAANPRISEAAELAIPIDKDQAKVVAEAMKQWLRE